MARIRLRDNEYDEGRLPKVCLVCGEPADTSFPQTFRWMPEWLSAVLVILAVTVPVGALIVYFATLGVVRRQRIWVPACSRHRDYWKRRAIWTYGPMSLGLAVGIVLMIVAFSQERGSGDWMVAPCFGTGVFFLVALMVGAVLQRGTVRSDQITDRDVSLIKVHEAFADAVIAARRARRERRERDWDEDEDERPRRRADPADGRDERIRGERPRRRGDDEDEE